LLQSQNREKTLQGIQDLYGKGYAQAYDSAVGIWGDERARDLQAAGRIQDLGTSVSNAYKTDIATLMASGATDRGIQQAMKDFDYQQFTENRDWDFRNLSGLLAALEGTKGSYTTQEITEEEKEGGGIAQVIGIAAAVIGAFYTGGATLALIPSMTDSG
jgi:predicted phage tail protein